MAESTAYTPGPWNTDGLSNSIYAPDGTRIADASDMSSGVEAGDERMANAELISAAPTLLRELIAAQWGDRSRPDGGACPSCCGIRTVEHADGSGTGHHPSCTLAAAIVDATGEWPR